MVARRTFSNFDSENHNKKELIHKETTITKIPTIEFNSVEQQNKINYNVSNSIEFSKNKNIDNIFFIILSSLFSNNKY